MCVGWMAGKEKLTHGDVEDQSAEEEECSATEGDGKEEKGVRGSLLGM